MQNGKEQIPAKNISEAGASIYLDISLATLPTGFRRAEYTINRLFFRARCPVFRQVQVHSVLLDLFDPYGGCFELGRAGLGIDGIDRQIVGGDLIVEM